MLSTFSFEQSQPSPTEPLPELNERDDDVLLATDYLYEGVLDPDATHARLATALDYLHESLDSPAPIGYPLPSDDRPYDRPTVDHRFHLAFDAAGLFAGPDAPPTTGAAIHKVVGHLDTTGRTFLRNHRAFLQSWLYNRIQGCLASESVEVDQRTYETTEREQRLVQRIERGNNPAVGQHFPPAIAVDGYVRPPEPPPQPKQSLLRQLGGAFGAPTNPPQDYEQKYYLHGYPQLAPALELFVAGEQTEAFDTITTFDLARDLRGAIDNDDRRVTLDKLKAAGGPHSLKAGEYLTFRDDALRGFNAFEERYLQEGSPKLNRRRYSSRALDNLILVGPLFAMVGGSELASQLDYISPDARNKYLLLVTSALAITSAMRREFKHSVRTPRFKNLESFSQP